MDHTDLENWLADYLRGQVCRDDAEGEVARFYREHAAEILAEIAQRQRAPRKAA